MASDYLLQIDGIKGESRDSFHPEKIEVASWSWGLSNTSASVPGSGGAGAGKASFQDFHFSMQSSKASPALFLKCATGEHIKSAKLFVRRIAQVQGAPQNQDYYVITLSDCLVSSFQAAGNPGSEGTGVPSSPPLDEMSMRFNKIEFSYSPQKPDGTLDIAVSGGWDIKTNKKI